MLHINGEDFWVLYIYIKYFLLLEKYLHFINCYEEIIIWFSCRHWYHLTWTLSACLWLYVPFCLFISTLNSVFLFQILYVFGNCFWICCLGNLACLDALDARKLSFYYHLNVFLCWDMEVCFASVKKVREFTIFLLSYVLDHV